VQVVKERYTYLASVGLFYNFGFLLLHIVNKINWNKILITTGIGLMVMFSAITSFRIHTWKDSFFFVG
jgi:hypothetical protein